MGAMENAGAVTVTEIYIFRVQGHRGPRRAPRPHPPARARAHVVRRPRDDEVVERPVAQRVVRRVGVDHLPGRGDRVGQRLDDVRHLREGLGLPPGPALLDPPDRRADPRPARTSRSTSTASPTPRAPRCSSSSSPTSAVSRSPPGCAPTSPSTPGATPPSTDLLRELEADLRPRPGRLVQAVARDRRRQHAPPRGRDRRPGPDLLGADRPDLRRGLRDAAPAPPRRRSLRRRRRRDDAWCAPTGSSSTSTGSPPTLPQLIGRPVPGPAAGQRRRPRLRQDPPRRAVPRDRPGPPARVPGQPAPRAGARRRVGHDPRRRDVAPATSSTLVAGLAPRRDRLDAAAGAARPAARPPCTSTSRPSTATQALAERSARPARAGRGRRTRQRRPAPARGGVCRAAARWRRRGIPARPARRHARSSTGWPSTPTCGGGCSPPWPRAGRRPPSRHRRRAGSATTPPPAASAPSRRARPSRPPRPRPTAWRRGVEEAGLPNSVLESVAAGLRDRARHRAARALRREVPRHARHRGGQGRRTPSSRSWSAASTPPRWPTPASTTRREAWLTAHPDAPAALRRLVAENRDPIARALRAQQRDADA